MTRFIVRPLPLAAYVCVPVLCLSLLLFSLLSLTVPSRVFAASRSSHSIAYVNYDDSGFSGYSGNIFNTSIIGGPAKTSYVSAPVTYNGMTFTPLPKIAINATALAHYDTLILFEVCDIATSLSSAQHAAINAYLAAGNKIILFDGDRCASIAGGNADYSWFKYPFKTSNPGPRGASGTLTIVEKSSLTNGLSSDPFNLDELGDANTATTADPHWFAAAKTTNALGNNGYFLAYARDSGLIIYDGADHWATDGPTKSLTDLFLNELNQQYDPDNLPSTTPIAPPPPPPTNRQIMFVHGIRGNYRDIKNGKAETTLIGPLVFRYKNVHIFSYYQDLGFRDISGCHTPLPDRSTAGLYVDPNSRDTTICDSDGALAYSAAKLHDELGAMPGPIAVIANSLGGAITRGWLSLAQQTRGDKSLHNADTVIFYQGGQQGSWASPAFRGTLFSLRFGGFIGVLAADLLHDVSARLHLDPYRPGTIDVSPQSLWYDGANVIDVPKGLNYYNFYTDIQPTISINYGLGSLKLGHVSFGDLVFLPGTANPTDVPPTGGARFLPGGRQTSNRHEYAVIKPYRFDELGLLDPAGAAALDAYLIGTDKANHFNFGSHIGDGQILVPSCSGGAMVDPIDEILRVLSNPAHGCS